MPSHWSVFDNGNSRNASWKYFIPNLTLNLCSNWQRPYPIACVFSYPLQLTQWQVPATPRKEPTLLGSRTCSAAKILSRQTISLRKETISARRCLVCCVTQNDRLVFITAIICLDKPWKIVQRTREQKEQQRTQRKAVLVHDGVSKMVVCLSIGSRLLKGPAVDGDVVYDALFHVYKRWDHFLSLFKETLSLSNVERVVSCIKSRFSLAFNVLGMYFDFMLDKN